MKTVIQNGMVCDGSGKEPEALDLLIENNRIKEISHRGAFAGIECNKIDAKGKTVAPGFIDVHAHGDKRKIRFPERKSVLLQGITTEIDGNCGNSDSTIPGECEGFKWNGPEEYAKLIDSLHIPVNTVVLAGHNSIRQHVMGNNPSVPTADELKAMQNLLEKSFAAGAAGWSSGLTYFPGKFAETNELKALSAVTSGSQKIYATHIRSEGDDLFTALEEAFAVANAGSCRLQISHLKTIFPRNYSKIDRMIEMIEARRSKGMDLHADRYPYIYSSTRIGQVLPAPYDHMTDISEKLRFSESFRDEITAALKNSPRDLETTILISENKTLAELAAEQKTSVEKACMETLMKSPEQSAAYLCMSEENLNRILKLPYVCAGTDGISCQLDDPGIEGHPRAVGSFPKFFHLVSQMLSVGEAIRKMTGLPATVFRIPDRGFIRKNYIADLVIFDSGTLDSKAGFDRKNLMPYGIERVMVNGKTAWKSSAPGEIGRFGSFISVN